ncbi:uncharacterized protein DNG_07649 [Cephalotrichum gorgonifer]|uniref:Uncharacterized protein n=1 Tax=Cephalotrichum gorgonifer TaxID=2041049 RepID=A0AAE8SXP1_9PEZI|nr:uncharacterized protein DNG_07649 [Cephalotrichum gorgonifer]
MPPPDEPSGELLANPSTVSSSAEPAAEPAVEPAVEPAAVPPGGASHVSSDCPSDESNSTTSGEDEDDPLFPFGPMPTEPIIARDREQAFRYLTYGKGRRCVVTADYEMMLAIGTPVDLKGYASGWFRAHGRLCRVVVTRAPTPPGWAQIVLSLEEDFYSDNGYEDGEGMEVDVDLLDPGIWDFDDFEEEDDVDYDNDMMEDLDDLEMDPDFLPGYGDHDGMVSESAMEDDEEDDDDGYTSSNDMDGGLCGNCKGDDHDLAECDGPTDAAGYLRGCPLCNTSDHDLDACEALDGPRNRRLVYKIYTRLVVTRCCKAPFYSEKMPWTRALLVSRAWGFNFPGPFPWSSEVAARRRAEAEAEEGEGEVDVREEDPATKTLEAVQRAICEGKVPDPGDMSAWMPERNAPGWGLDY